MDEDEQIAANVAKMRAQGATDDQVRHYLVNVEGRSPVGGGPAAIPRAQSESTRVTPAAPRAQDAVGMPTSAMLGATHAGTYNFADEVAGLVGAAAQGSSYTGGLNKAASNYRTSRNDYRSHEDAARQANPKTFGVGELLGGLAPILATSGAGAAASEAGIGKQLVRAMGQGVGYGALSGAGSADELSDVPGHAAVGGVIGGVTAPALLLAGRGIGSAYRNLTQSKGDAAQDLIRQRIANSGTTPDAMLNQVAGNVEASGDKPEMLGDYASEVAKLTKNVTKRPGTGRALIQDAISSRNAGAAERVASDLGHGSSVGPALPSAEDLIRSRATSAGEQFPAAYADPAAIDDPRLLELLKRPTFRKAYQMAQTMAADEGRDLPSTITHELAPGAQTMLDQAQVGDREALLQRLVQSGAAREVKTPVPDVKTMAYIDRALRRMIDQGYEGGSPIVDPGHAQALQGAFGEFRDLLEQQSPAYAQAVQNYAGRSGSIDAALLGRRLSDAVQPISTKATNLALGEGDPAALSAVTRGLPAAEKAVGGMSPFDAGIFRQEARGAAQNAIERTPATDDGSTTSVLRSVFPNSIAGKRAQSLMFDSPEGANAFQHALGRERNMARVGAMMRGSDTIENAAENADVAPKTVFSLLRKPTALVGKGLDYLEERKARGLYEHLAPMLAAQGAQPLQNVLGQLSAHPEASTLPSGLEAALRNLLISRAADR